MTDYAPGDERYTGPTLTHRTGDTDVYMRRTQGWTREAHCATPARAWEWMWRRAWLELQQRQREDRT